MPDDTSSQLRELDDLLGFMAYAYKGTTGFSGVVRTSGPLVPARACVLLEPP